MAILKSLLLIAESLYSSQLTHIATRPALAGHTDVFLDMVMMTEVTILESRPSTISLKFVGLTGLDPE